MKQKAKVMFYTQGESDNVRILLGKRTSGGDTFWWLPGGSIDEGEVAFEAVLRELGEELILGECIKNVLNKYLYTNELPKNISYKTSNAQYIVFLIPVPSGAIEEAIVIKEEFEEIKWHSYTQMPDNMSREYEFLKPLLSF